MIETMLLLKHGTKIRAVAMWVTNYPSYYTKEETEVLKRWMQEEIGAANTKLEGTKRNERYT